MHLLRKYYELFVAFLKGDGAVYSFILIALALRVHNFSSTSIWRDEGSTLEIIHKSFINIIKVSLEDVNAPFYMIITRIWSMLFGYSLPAVRFFSIVCSVLTVAVVFKTADKNFGRKAAVISSLLLCFSNLHIYYSEEARCYALLCLNASITLYFFLELLKEPRKKNFFFYALFATLTIYTHFFFGLQLIFQGIILLILYRKDTLVLKQILISNILVALFFAAWFIPTFIYKSKVNIDNSWIPKFSIELMTWYFRELFNHEYIAYAILAIYIIASLFIIIKYKRFTTSKKAIIPIFFVAGLPFIAMCFVAYVIIPIFYPRFALYTSIPLIISIGSCFSYLFRKRYLLLLVVIFSAWMIGYLKVSAFRNQEWNKTPDLQEPFRTDSSYVVVSPHYDEFCYVYYNLSWAYEEEFKSLFFFKDQYRLSGLNDSVTFIQKKLFNYKRILFYDGDPNYDDRMLTYLRNHYDSVYVKHLFGVDFRVFDKRNEDRADSTEKRTTN